MCINTIANLFIFLFSFLLPNIKVIASNHSNLTFGVTISFGKEGL